METINGLYKTECIRTTVFHDGPYKTIADVEYATAGWVDWYNERRLHGTLGMLTLSEYEQAHYAAPSRSPHESGREPGALHRGWSPTVRNMMAPIPSSPRVRGHHPVHYTLNH